LTFNGLSVEDVELVDLGPSGIVDAVVRGDVDAGFTWDPYVYYMTQALGDNAVSWPGQSDFYFLLLAKKAWLENNAAVAERFVKSLIEAEEYVETNSEAAKEFVRNRFDYDPDYIDYSWPRQEYAVVLAQAMLIAFEDQARWMMERGLTDQAEVPNFLTYIHVGALEAVRPEAVTILR